MRLDDLPIRDTAATRAATEVLHRYAGPALAGLDVSGRRLPEWPAGLRDEVLAAWPRLDLAERFTACFAGQAARKPDSSAAAAIRSGLADRIAANPLER